MGHSQEISDYGYYDSQWLWNYNSLVPNVDFGCVEKNYFVMLTFA